MIEERTLKKLEYFEILNKISQYTTQLNTYISETVAKWIVSGGVEDDWDAFQKKLQSMKLNELLGIYQEALDAFNKN